MKKLCRTLDVLTVVTGIMLVDGKESEYQGVMDILYPGIMTIGCAAMQLQAAEEIKRQHPAISGFLSIESPEAGLERFNGLALAAFGATIEIAGPHKVSEAEIDEAFKSLRTRQ